MRENLPATLSRLRLARGKRCRLLYLVAIVKTNCDFGDLPWLDVDRLWFWRRLTIHSERRARRRWPGIDNISGIPLTSGRSEEHTSELQSLTNLVCRLLLEKKKKTTKRM